MSEADKKFKELGFEKIEKKTTINYRKDCNGFEKLIWFNLNSRKIYLQYDVIEIEQEEIEAVNMKRKELFRDELV
jgi:hypothetical protein